MSSQYAVPLNVFGSIRAQAPPGLGAVLMQELQSDLLKELTRRITEGQTLIRPKPQVLASLDTRVFEGVLWIFAESLDAGAGGRRSWARKAVAKFNPSLSDVQGPEWVYPGDAAGGLFRDTVSTVISKSKETIERVTEK